MNIKEEKIREAVSKMVRIMVDLFESIDQPPMEPAEVVTAKPEWMSRDQYAEHRQVSKSTLIRWETSGMPVFRDGGPPRINVEKADAWLAAGGLGRRKAKAKRGV